MAPKPSSKAVDKAKSDKKPGDGDANGRTVNTSSSDTTSFRVHQTMPLLAADKYAVVNIPDLREFDPEEIKLDATSKAPCLYRQWACS
jgi:hypothetical protein